MYSFVGNVITLLFSCAICIGQAFASQAPPHRVKVEFRLAEWTPRPGLALVTVPHTGEKIYLHKAAIITNKDIIEAHAEADPSILGHYQVTVVFTKRAAERMRNATTPSRGKGLAILIDCKVISALSITSSIYDKAAITGPWTKEEAESLGRALDPKSSTKTADSSRVAGAGLPKGVPGAGSRGPDRRPGDAAQTCSLL